jgi:tripartite-type tricarboxylate transporter receptor subunit TctC
MRRLALVFAMTFGLILQPSWAADYPTRRITIVVPTSPGGPTDVLARILAQKLNESWGQPVIVENRGGTNAILGARAVATSAADGYELLLTNDGPMAITPALQSNVGYDPVNDFTPISLVTWSPLVLVVHPSVPAKSVSELIVHLRERPGALNYAAGGTTTQLAAELFKKMTKTEIQPVMFRGSAPAITAVMGGEIQMMIDAIASSLPFIQSGQLRALAVAGASRSSILPELPTISEAGVPGYSASTWLGLFGPRNLSPDVRQRLEKEVIRIINLPDVKNRLPQIGLEPVGSSSEEFGRIVRQDVEKWSAIIRELGLRQP